MHKNIYKIKAAFSCNENFINSIRELKPFLGFDLNEINLQKETKSINFENEVLKSENRSKPDEDLLNKCISIIPTKNIVDFIKDSVVVGGTVWALSGSELSQRHLLPAAVPKKIFVP